MVEWRTVFVAALLVAGATACGGEASRPTTTVRCLDGTCSTSPDKVVSIPEGSTTYSDRYPVLDPGPAPYRLEPRIRYYDDYPIHHDRDDRRPCVGDCMDMDGDGRTWNDVDGDGDGLYESW